MKDDVYYLTWKISRGNMVDYKTTCVKEKKLVQVGSTIQSGMTTQKLIRIEYVQNGVMHLHSKI